MSLWEKIITGIKNPMMALWVILPGKFWSAWSDTAYLRFLFRARTGRKLNLEDPKGFHEKLQWLKLYDRRPEYTMMADKVAVRAYIAEKLGEEYLIPLLGVWNDPHAQRFPLARDPYKTPWAKPPHSRFPGIHFSLYKELPNQA